jgi:hypothetical protein
MSSKGFAARAQAAGDQWANSQSRCSGYLNKGGGSSESTNSGAHYTSSTGNTEQSTR